MNPERFVIFDHTLGPVVKNGVEYYSTFDNVGEIITMDTFIDKLNSDLQTTIIYRDTLDIYGEPVAFLEFFDITGESTIDLSGIPLSIFNETYNIGRLQPYQSIGSRFTTLNASNNKLVFKYITIYSNMTISDGTNSVTYIPESMFIMNHDMESD